MKTKSVGKHVGSSEAGGDVQLSHQEAKTISPCNSANSIVILGDVVSSSVIKITGPALSMQHVMKFSHQVGHFGFGVFFFASPNSVSLSSTQTLVQHLGIRAGIPLWVLVFPHKAQNQGGSNGDMPLEQPLFISQNLFFIITYYFITCYTYHGGISGTNQKLYHLMGLTDNCPSFIKRNPQGFLLDL